MFIFLHEKKVYMPSNVIYKVMASYHIDSLIGRFLQEALSQLNCITDVILYHMKHEEKNETR